MDSVAIYCRLSDEDRGKDSRLDESESIKNQKMLLSKYAVEKGWIIYNIYSDDDYSGLDRERPEFNRMLKDGESGKFNIVLCKHQSRFTRDMELVEKYLHGKLPEWGIRFISITDNADTSDNGNKKSRQINGLINEWYSEDLSELIRATFNIKREQGQFIGSSAPYGYIKDPDNKNKLIIDKEAALVVQKIYDLYLEGYGTQSIAYMLNEEGIPSPAKYKQDKGLSKSKQYLIDEYGFWNKATVKRILKNQMYIGNMVQGKTAKLSYKSKKRTDMPPSNWIIVRDTHEAIICNEDFYDVQIRMSSRVRSTGEGKAHIFASKVQCLDCGSTMNKVSRGQYSYLRCKLYCTAPKKKLCTSHSISLHKLIHIITERVRCYINAHCSDLHLASDLEREQRAKVKTTSLDKNMKELINRSREIGTSLTNAYQDKTNGKMSDLEYRIIRERLTEEFERLPLECRRLEYKKVKSNISNISSWSEIIADYKDFEQLTPRMVNKLIDYIAIGEKEKECGEQNIEIHWNF